MKSAKVVEKGAERYVTGEILPFDQKNEMFKRPLRDPQMLDLGKKFYFDRISPKNTPGYTLYDQALVNAAWRLEDECAQGVRGGRMGLYAWDWPGKFSFPRVRRGLKVEINDPKTMSRNIKKAATFFGASLVGICKVDRRWLYSPLYLITREGGKTVENNLPETLKYAVVIAVEMDYTGITTAPAHPASAATGLGYSRMAFTAGLLVQYIRGLGYQAVPCGNDTACSIPLAIDAGLGELGRNGLLITPRFGPRVRLAKVFTDLPLVPDRPIAFGVWEFCQICGKCAEKCPSQSIMRGGPTAETHNISNRENVRAWHINAETCLAFWVANGTDCATCIRVCPFNKPWGIHHEFVRWLIRTQPRFNRFLLQVDTVLGYGKRKAAAAFWGDPDLTPPHVTEEQPHQES